jgi:hypothetical protein
MLTDAGVPHTAAAPLDSRTLPRVLPDSRTIAAHTTAHVAALPGTPVRSAANCSTLHEFE